ncbi:MAG: nucleotidyltransferase family protein [Paracoccaceae bacterium]
MKKPPNAAMIFAAGLGTRMGDLTRTRPKPLIPVAGRALIDRALDIAAGLSPIVVNTHYRAAQLHRYLADRPVTISHEPELLETGGGLRAARPLLGAGPVFTLNSDIVWSGPNPLSALRAGWDPDRMDALLLLVDLANAQAHRGKGDFVRDASGRLTRGHGWVYAGAQIIKPETLDGIDETAFSLNRVWDGVIARKRLFGLCYAGRWCDVGSPAGIAEAEAMLRGCGDV